MASSRSSPGPWCSSLRYECNNYISYCTARYDRWRPQLLHLTGIDISIGLWSRPFKLMDRSQAQPAGIAYRTGMTSCSIEDTCQNRRASAGMMCHRGFFYLFVSWSTCGCSSFVARFFFQAFWSSLAAARFHPSYHFGRHLRHHQATCSSLSDGWPSFPALALALDRSQALGWRWKPYSWGWECASNGSWSIAAPRSLGCWSQLW